jgi:hypothetical protein
MGSGHPPPSVRKLRVYAFDPQTASTLGSIGYAYATIALPWEEPWEEELKVGPVNEYLEVVDVDPASGKFYEPLDLNDPHLLAQDGLTPSEGNPQFHQQMVLRSCGGLLCRRARSDRSRLRRRRATPRLRERLRKL